MENALITTETVIQLAEMDAASLTLHGLATGHNSEHGWRELFDVNNNMNDLKTANSFMSASSSRRKCGFDSEISNPIES